MGALRNIALFVLTVSFLTFVAFFGRLPAFRNTPISFLHRLLWIHIPSFVRRVDMRLTGGRASRAGARFGNYLMNEPHPLVMIFFLSLVTISALLILRQTYFHLPLAHRVAIPLVVSTPYLFTYLTARAQPSQTITRFNVQAHVARYPYDHVIFHPFQSCSTCILPKPARSKHCRLCNMCVARSDHHCVWVNNCVGSSNLRWFLLLLASMTLVCLYGAVIAHGALAPAVHARLNILVAKNGGDAAAVVGDLGDGVVGRLVAKGRWFGLGLSYGISIGGMQIAGVGLLAALTWPLPLGLLAYHIYLLWAGMTTNESAKWEDLKEDIHDGLVCMAKRRRHEVRGRPRTREPEDEVSTEWEMEEQDGGQEWPVKSRLVVVRMEDEEVPKELPKQFVGLVEEDSWRRCYRLAELENIYDMGFWYNLADVFRG